MRRSALQRRTRLRRLPMRRGARRSKYSRRERDWAFMGFVKTLVCSVTVEAPDPARAPTSCLGPIEADHDSRGRGIGQKSDDRSCIPVCTGHHRERHDFAGSFKHLTRDDVRAWFSRAQARVQELWLLGNRLAPLDGGLC